MESLQSRTWAEISLDNLAHNYRVLRDFTPSGCRFLGVVKANAYGHGAVAIARRLEALGADYLGVATLDEAAELRAGGIQCPVLIFGYTPPELADALCRLNLTQTVFDLETAKALSAHASDGLKIHVKVDTGMSRLGFFGRDMAREIAAACTLPNLIPEGIYTHFAAADGDDAYTDGQFAAFSTLIETLAKGGHVFSLRHCAASAAILRHPQTHLDMIRPGIALYGSAPGVDTEQSPLRPVMTLHARICAVRRLPAGTKIGYGCTHTLARDSVVAVLPIGYADGLPRALSNRGAVLVKGVRIPILGRVCMDFCMADATDLPSVSVGDAAVLFGAGLPVDTQAECADTIPHELLCAVSARVPRVAGQPPKRIY